MPGEGHLQSPCRKGLTLFKLKSKDKSAVDFLYLISLSWYLGFTSSVSDIFSQNKANFMYHLGNIFVSQGGFLQKGIC